MAEKETVKVIRETLRVPCGRQPKLWGALARMALLTNPLIVSPGTTPAVPREPMRRRFPDLRVAVLMGI